MSYLRSLFDSLAEEWSEASTKQRTLYIIAAFGILAILQSGVSTYLEQREAEQRWSEEPEAVEEEIDQLIGRGEYREAREMIDLYSDAANTDLEAKREALGARLQYGGDSWDESALAGVSADTSGDVATAEELMGAENEVSFEDDAIAEEMPHVFACINQYVDPTYLSIAVGGNHVSPRVEMNVAHADRLIPDADTSTELFLCLMKYSPFVEDRGVDYQSSDGKAEYSVQVATNPDLVQPPVDGAGSGVRVSLTRTYNSSLDRFDFDTSIREF